MVFFLKCFKMYLEGSISLSKRSSEELRLEKNQAILDSGSGLVQIFHISPGRF